MRIYILEDEVNIQEYMRSILYTIPYVKIVGTSHNCKDAINEIPLAEPDLILADIQLKDDVSFKVFESVAVEKYQIIFITAYSQYAIRALNIGALGYILKPFEMTELVDAIDRAHEKQDFKITQQQFEVTSKSLAKPDHPKKIVVRSQDYIQFINCDDILYCESEKGYTTFFLNDGSKIMVSKVLKEYENVLNTSNFFRCHQSYIVNMKFVTKYFKEGYLHIKGTAKIPVSTRKREDVLKYFIE